jgi:hypothetical protein
MSINNVHTSQLAIIIAGLVKEGIVFKAVPTMGMSGEYWEIILTGGY